VPDGEDVLGAYRAVGRDSRTTILELLGSERHFLPETHEGERDLVWSVSVFTHLTDHWAGWLAELHRVLAPGGLAIVSFLGGAMYGAWTGDAWDPAGSA